MFGEVDFRKKGNTEKEFKNLHIYSHQGLSLNCTFLGKTLKNPVESNRWKAETGISVAAHCVRQSLEFESHQIKAAW